MARWRQAVGLILLALSGCADLTIALPNTERASLMNGCAREPQNCPPHGLIIRHTWRF